MNDFFNKIIESSEYYVREAEQSAQHGLYFSACIMLAAYLEARLIAWFDLHSNLPIRNRQKCKEKFGITSLFDYIECLEKAGWFSEHSNPQKFKKAIHEIRKVRNYLHPMKWAEEGLKQVSEEKWLKSYNILIELQKCFEVHA